MPKLTFSNKPCILGIHHTKEAVFINDKIGTQERRLTRIKLTVGQNKEDPGVTVQTLCCPTDQFCKLQGRREAANKLLRSELVRKHFPDKAQRLEIFTRICPEYSSRPSRKNLSLQKGKVLEAPKTITESADSVMKEFVDKAK